MATRILPNGMVVTRTHIPTTCLVTYRAYEFSGMTIEATQHFSITSFEGLAGWYGDVSTHCLPPEIDALPAMSRKRIEAAQAFQRHQADQALWAIISAFPEVTPTTARLFHGGADIYHESEDAAAAAAAA